MERETYHHGSLRVALLEQARAILDEGGPASVTLRETARRAGVSATATYRHFRDKDALLAAVAAEGFEQFAVRLAASIQGGRPFTEMGRAYIKFALERPGLFRLMFSPLIQAREAHPDLAIASAKAFEVLNSAAKTAGELSTGAPPSPIAAWALVHGLSHLMLDGVFPPDQRAEIIEAIIRPPAN